MESPEVWQWMFLATAAAFLIGEMLTPGTFFMLPFGIGGAAGAIAGFAGAGVTVQWGLFTLVSVVAFLALRPIAKRLDQSGTDEGIGVKRLIGADAVAMQPISGQSGMIQVESEEWRAVSEDGSSIPTGAEVTIVEMRGTRVVVRAR